jgi:hypothetical protein
VNSRFHRSRALHTMCATCAAPEKNKNCVSALRSSHLNVTPKQTKKRPGSPPPTFNPPLKPPGILFFNPPPLGGHATTMPLPATAPTLPNTVNTVNTVSTQNTAKAGRPGFCTPPAPGNSPVPAVPANPAPIPRGPSTIRGQDLWAWGQAQP